MHLCIERSRNERRWCTNASPLLATGTVDSGNNPRPNGTGTASVSAIIQNIKSVSARKINQTRKTPGAPVWQRNYYERVIRNQNELDRARDYIRLNPGRWAEDRENPRNLRIEVRK